MWMILAALLSTLLPAEAGESRWLVSPDRWLSAPPTVDPDAPGLMFLSGTSPLALAGGDVGIYGTRAERAMSLGISGFLEVHTLETTPRPVVVPWESYRANIGFDLRMRLSPRDARLRTHLDLLWHHESDHASSTRLSEIYGLSPEALPNEYLSTFEYLLLRPVISGGGRLWGEDGPPVWVVGAGARLYTPNLLPFDHSRRTFALSVDARLEGALSEHVGMWAGAYSEIVFNDYDAPRPTDFRGGSYRSSVAQLGLALRSDGWYVFEPMFDTRVGNGRGVDFALVKSAAFNFGFRIRR